jgi:hypothetical protein
VYFIRWRPTSRMNPAQSMEMVGYPPGVSPSAIIVGYDSNTKLTVPALIAMKRRSTTLLAQMR